jgi:hypothetical protein
MIYHPRRAALELKRRIFEIMTPEEQKAYLTSVPASVDPPVGEAPPKPSQREDRSPE